MLRAFSFQQVKKIHDLVKARSGFLSDNIYLCQFTYLTYIEEEVSGRQGTYFGQDLGSYPMMMFCNGAMC